MAERYFVINKPYDMVSQFVSTHAVKLLGQLSYKFPEGTHAIGRLDKNSEGLLILTTNKKVTRLLFSSLTPHKRIYMVQVKNIISDQKLDQLRQGINIRIKGGEKYITPACNVCVIDEPEALYRSVNSFSKYGQHTWLLITLTEGKYHQVRKMIGAIHHRVQRLIRISIEDLLLDNLEPGQVREIEEEDFFKKLKIENWKQPVD